MTISNLKKQQLLKGFLGLIILSPSMGHAQQIEIPATKYYVNWAGRTPAKQFPDGTSSCQYAMSISPRWTNVTWNSTKGHCEAIIMDPGAAPYDYSSGGWVSAFYSCPTGYSYFDKGICHLSGTLPPKKTPPGECAGNPIYYGEGIKRQTEIDYKSSNIGALKFLRIYSSKQARGYDTMLSIGEGSFGRMGGAWLHNFSKTVIVDNIQSPTAAFVYRPDGTFLIFKYINKAWVSDADVSDQLFKSETGWKFIEVASDTVEDYNLNGLLTLVTDRAGLKQTLLYGAANGSMTEPMAKNILQEVSDQFGHKLKFKYDSNGRLVSLVDPSGQEYTYSYNDAGDLDSVVYPDKSSRRYLYDESDFVQNTSAGALTGIIDENSARYATFKYYGYPTSTEHYSGAEKYTIQYKEGNNITITDPLGTQRNYRFANVLGVMRSIGQDQPAGSGCSASSSSISYDNNGNIASRTDFNGVTVTYTYDLTRNLETSRTEAQGKPEARTITTAWHGKFNIPTKIAEPLKVTTFTHDSSGNVLTKTERATTDLNGSLGFAATVTGVPRTWTYTYNAMGQVLTVKGPRTDVADITTYTYDERGDLRSVKNAVQQETKLSDYDANGRVGTITEPNNVVTSMAYYPRGWLKSRSVTAGGVTEKTSYEYDNAGQLVKVTLPDASTVSYTYDDAHRLIGIADSLGNTISYALDNMGNRVGEQVKNPAGGLTRQTMRIMDALNRVQQITGAK